MNLNFCAPKHVDLSADFFEQVSFVSAFIFFRPFRRNAYYDLFTLRKVSIQ